MIQIFSSKEFVSEAINPFFPIFIFFILFMKISTEIKNPLYQKFLCTFRDIFPVLLSFFQEKEGLVKKRKEEKRFQMVESGANNCIFIKTTLQVFIHCEILTNFQKRFPSNSESDKENDRLFVIYLVDINAVLFRYTLLKF